MHIAKIQVSNCDVEVGGYDDGHAKTCIKFNAHYGAESSDIQEGSLLGSPLVDACSEAAACGTKTLYWGLRQFLSLSQ